MPWHQIKQGQTLRQIAEQHKSFCRKIWEDQRNAALAGASTDGYEVNLPTDQWIYVPTGKELGKVIEDDVFVDPDTAAGEFEAETEEEAPQTRERSNAVSYGGSRARSNAIVTQSNVTSTFRRPRSNAVTEDDVKYILPAARAAFKDVHESHHGTKAKLKAAGRYHNVSFKKSKVRKAAGIAPGVVTPVVVLILGTAASGGLLVPLGLGMVALGWGISAFYHHRDYKRRAAYYTHDMYVTPPGERTEEFKYQKQKDKARKKMWRRAIMTVAPNKIASYAKVKETAREESEFWRVRLTRDADECIRPAVVHMRKAHAILAEKMGGFYRVIDPEFKDPEGLIVFEETKPEEPEEQLAFEWELDADEDEQGVLIEDYKPLNQCDHFVDHARPALRYLHELNKFRNYLLPGLNLCRYYADEFASMSESWQRHQGLVENAIDRFMKKANHKGCRRFRPVKAILTPGKFNTITAGLPKWTLRCFSGQKAVDTYLFQGQDGQTAGGQQDQSGGNGASGSKANEKLKTLDISKVKEMLTDYALNFQKEIRSSKSRVQQREMEASYEGSMGEVRYRRFLADLSDTFDHPSKITAFTHRIQNYNMSTTKSEKFSCFVEHGFSVAQAAMGGKFIGTIAGWERPVKPPLDVAGLVNSMGKAIEKGDIRAIFQSAHKGATAAQKLAPPSPSSVVISMLKNPGSINKAAVVGNLEKYGKMAADPALKKGLQTAGAAKQNRDAKGPTASADAYRFAYGTDPFLKESEVLATLKNELRVENPVARMFALETKLVEDEYNLLKEDIVAEHDAGKIDAAAKDAALKELDETFYPAERSKDRKATKGKKAKQAAIAVERVFKQADYHFKKARELHELLEEIDEMREQRGEQKIMLRSCTQSFQYASILYEFHHEMEKLERYLMASVSVVSELAEEAIELGYYEQSIWTIFDSVHRQWIRHIPNHDNCLRSPITGRKSQYCYGPRFERHRFNPRPSKKPEIRSEKPERGL